MARGCGSVVSSRLPIARNIKNAEIPSYISLADCDHSWLNGSPRKAASAALRSSFVKGLGILSVMPRSSASRREWSRLRINHLSAPAVQTGVHGDSQSRIEIDCSLRHHCSAAFVTGLHDHTVTLALHSEHPPEVLVLMRNGPPFRSLQWAFRERVLGHST